MPSRRHRRRRTAAVVGVAGVATLALCTAPGTYAAFSDFGTVGVHAQAAVWGDSTPDWLARCGDLSKYGEVVFADPISIFGVSFAAIDGDNAGSDSGHPKIIDLPTGSSRDQIIVGASNAINVLYGGNGKDCLVGGDESDVLFGGNGKDVLLGGGGADFLFGGQGDDTLYGGGGIDTMDGGPGNDDVYTDGADSLFALPSEIHTPDPTAGTHLLALRVVRLTALVSGGDTDTDTTACSASLEADLPDTPPTGAHAQDLIDSLDATKAQCLVDDADSAKGSLSSTLSDSPSSTTSSTPTDPKTESTSTGDQAPSNQPTQSNSPTPTPTPTPTPSDTQTSSAAAPTGQPSSDTPSGTGSAGATSTGAATTPSTEGGQS
ncbi:MAG TPA: calcium-binding protein [Jatrophihabitantaceae bacterium]|nr:calcium-binding protein [Jatrophihabitantaceae bacterium]